MTYTILDIDLDYFNEVTEPALCLERMLRCSGCYVNILYEKHNHAFTDWKQRFRIHGIPPTHILHVDEHHDMLNERKQANLGNFMFHAMCLWPACRVHWLVQHPIDSPAVWLEDETWESLRKRFSYGPHMPRRWPEPDIVSVSTSPDFVPPDLAKELLNVVRQFLPPQKKLRKAELQALDHSNHDYPKPKRQSGTQTPGQGR